MTDNQSPPEEEYIGYRAPPKATRFKPGNHEHLKRRKKQQADLATILRDFLEEMIPYRDGHKSKRGRRIDVYLKWVESKALKGDLMAINELMDMRENLFDFAALERKFIHADENDALL
jgi:hypothetical protein